MPDDEYEAELTEVEETYAADESGTPAADNDGAAFPPPEG